MGDGALIVSTLLEPRAKKVDVGHPESDRAAALLGGAPSKAGIEVNERNALTFSAVWSAVTILSDAIAILPAKTYRRLDGDARRHEPSHVADRLLRVRPNPQTKPSAFKRLLMAWRLLWGNGFAEIERDRAGRPLNLWPIHPSRVRMEKTRDGQLVYVVLQNDLAARAPEVTVPPEDVYHTFGLSLDGMWGLSVVGHARESMGLGLATERFGALFFGNGARPLVVLEHPGKPSKEAEQRLRESWQQMHGGDNALGTAVLKEGMKANVIGMPNEDAQFLETRRFQTLEIARWFNLPPHMLKDLERATFSNIEHQSIEFVRHSLMPHVTDFEEEAELKLLTESERERMFVEFTVDALLRGDTASRYRAYGIAIKDGWLTRNEARRKENLDPDEPDLDKYLMPLNMAVVGEEPDETQDTESSANDDSDEQDEPTEPDAESDDDERQATLAAHRELLVEAINRVHKLTCDRAIKAAKRPDQWVRWIDERLPEFAGDFDDRVGSVIRAVQSLGVDADGNRLREHYLRGIREALLIASECKPEELARSVADWCASSKETIAEILADGVVPKRVSYGEE